MLLRSFRKTAGALSFGLVAAAIAALVAHVVIDVIGDYALARDTYDGLEHASRGLVSLGLLLGVAVLACRFVVAALSGGRERARVSAQLHVPHSPLLFVAAVVAATLVLLVGMESLDALAAGHGFDGLADVFGGSTALGFAVAVSAAIALGQMAWATLRWFAACHRDLLRAIEAIFVTLFPVRVPQIAFARTFAYAPQACAVLSRAAKRGPPAFLSP